MSDETPRRRRPEDEAPELPSGYRQSRRSSRAARQARKAIKVHKVRSDVQNAARTASERLKDALLLAGLGLSALAASVLVLMLVATAINGAARWAAKRSVDKETEAAVRKEKARDNILVIGVADGRAQGFLAARIEAKTKRIFGIAIPDGAFMEVPGQGFERIGDSYAAGADVSEAAVSNYLSVPFEAHVIVDAAVYQDALKRQSLRDVLAKVQGSDLSDDEIERLQRAIGKVPAKEVALVPLPVKPVNVGGQTYFEPQREEVADLLESWWGVKLGAEKGEIRIIVLNGSGVPGIAGVAAQQLIKQGFRVVDTRNSDRFDRKETQIVLHHAVAADGERVRRALGVGRVFRQESDEDVADIIVIIGRDFAPGGKDG